MYTRALTLTKSGVYLSPDKVSSINTVEQDPIVSGEAFMTTALSNQFVAISVAAKRDLKMINLPKGTNDKKAGLYDQPSQFFAVSANSKYKTASVQFINYFTNDIDANKVLLAERGVPVSSKVYNALKSVVDPNMEATFEYVNTCDKNKVTSLIDPPYPDAAGQVDKVMQDSYNKVVYQKESVSQAASDFMSQAKSLLSSQ